MDLKTYIYKLVNSGEVDELNDAGYGVLILNYAGVIIYANRAFEKYLGQEPFFFVDKNYTDFVPEHSIRKSLKGTYVLTIMKRK